MDRRLKIYQLKVASLYSDLYFNYYNAHVQIRELADIKYKLVDLVIKEGHLL